MSSFCLVDEFGNANNSLLFFLQWICKTELFRSKFRFYQIHVECGNIMLFDYSNGFFRYFLLLSLPLMPLSILLSKFLLSSLALRFSIFFPLFVPLSCPSLCAPFLIRFHSQCHWIDELNVIEQINQPDNSIRRLIEMLIKKNYASRSYESINGIVRIWIDLIDYIHWIG